MTFGGKLTDLDRSINLNSYGMNVQSAGCRCLWKLHQGLLSNCACKYLTT